ncbi:MAG TPA: guanosine polyphosphate pyrophosphohydrolase [Pseudothermotoga sp.]|nr:guanosine polyphosphate pyrophosphohydrolase [Pseudothermotoga sp.]HOK82769.1 guanosine polyphosphate pyrophosphohydrolase [Pseudothermotoga sp.]HPP70793.1 guanosine polyphosphate pyrophosphohydrolase [Pseudothermotoga sp.]
MIAVLDLGSNSFILLIYDKGRTVLEQVYEVGLRSYKDDEEAFCVAKNALEKIKEQIKGIDSYAFGTAVFRERPWLFHNLVNRFGLKGKILSEKEEAYLTYHCVDPQMIRRVTVFDLGGGSLEIVKRDRFVSLPLGTHVLNSIFNLSLPGAPEFEQATNCILEKLPDFEEGIGIGGSFVAIAALIVGKWDLNLLDGFILRFEDVQGVYEKLRKLNYEQIADMKVIPAGRERTIIAGCAVAKAITVKKNISVSTKGFRYTLARMIEEGKWPTSGVPGEI